MKTLTVSYTDLLRAGRWDIDFHLSPIEISRFPTKIVSPVSWSADIVKTKRDPSKQPSEPFLYVDISSIDVETGVIVRPQELTGEEAPSRARKVIHAYDVIISTCRPTRGAIAVVPENLHGQICSTGFSVIRAKEQVNPFYLHFALRLPSTIEQFRKWSTGSSYPAILDDDVAKTLIPVPATAVQDKISKSLRLATGRRDEAIAAADRAWTSEVGRVNESLGSDSPFLEPPERVEFPYSVEQIWERLRELGPVSEEPVTAEDLLEESLLNQDDPYPAES